MADKPPIYKKRPEDEEPVGRGKIWTDPSDNSRWKSYGSSGTKKGGSRWKKEDEEGDFDEEGWNKARDRAYEGDRGGKGIRAIDRKYPDDPKGWRREFLERAPDEEVPTS